MSLRELYDRVAYSVGALGRSAGALALTLHGLLKALDIEDETALLDDLAGDLDGKAIRIMKQEGSLGGEHPSSPRPMPRQSPRPRG